MSWRLIGKPATQKVTKKLAKEYAEMEAAPCDRPLSERRLAVYQRILSEGGFRPCTWASALCVETGGLYRVNGKHTSMMLSGLDVVPEFFVTVEEYECDTLEDVARLYSTFDSQMQSRTAKDIYSSFAGTVPELREVANRTICLAASGMSYKEGWEMKPAAERAELLLEHPEFVLWLNELWTAGRDDRVANGYRQSKHLIRQPVVAAMFATWQKAKANASEFWSAVRDETGVSPKLPDRTLARYLLTVGVDSGSGSARVRKAQPREFYVKCLHAWNAWRKGEATNLNYYPDKDVPAVK